MRNPQLLGIIRHIMTLIGGFLVAVGVLTEDLVGQVTEAVIAIVGAVLTLIGLVASWKAPEKKK